MYVNSCERGDTQSHFPTKLFNIGHSGPGSSYRVIRTAKVGCTGSKITMFCYFRALNKLLGPFKLILSEWA